jgi:integrase
MVTSMSDDLIFGAYLAEWLERQRTQLQPSTWESYRGVVRRHLLANLGDMPLGALTKRDFERLYARIFLGGGVGGRPLSRRSVGYVHGVAHKALEDAVDDGLLERNPAHRATLPKVDHAATGDTGERLATWDAEQLRAFLAGIADSRYGPLFLVAAFTGLRRGELCGLRWQDVDLDRKVLHVRRALTIIRRQVRLKPPKSSRARALHIDDAVVEALGRQRAWQREQAATLGPVWHNRWDLVFTADTGRPLVPDSVSRAFKETVQQLPVPRIRLHDVRHTHATLMLQAGVPIKVVSERLGHASAQLTMDIYAHVLPAMDSAAAAAFSAHVLGNGGPV